MDPNEALHRIRQIVAETYGGDFTADDALDLLDDLAETVDGLDQWLSRGGFRPSAWDVGGAAIPSDRRAADLITQAQPGHAARRPTSINNTGNEVAITEIAAGHSEDFTI